MRLATVIGTIWATRRHAGTEDLKMLLIQPLDAKGQPFGRSQVAFDAIGCGEGEMVYFVDQYEATLAFPDRKLVPIDCSIVGIVDSLEDQSDAVLGGSDLGKAGA